MDSDSLELVTSERVATVVHLLHLGDEPTTRKVAETTGVTWDGAYKMMCRISRVLPVALIDGRWVLMTE